MNHASHPDANRLVYRIRTAITGESKGLDTAKLAWQYAVAIERANAALSAAHALLQKDQMLDAVILEHDFPRLIEAATELDFPQTEVWAERCRAYGWRQPGKIDSEALQAVTQGLESIEDQTEWLFGEYRNAIRAKDSHNAFRIIRVLSAKNPDDPNAKEELQRHRSALFQEAADAVRNALEELIPSEKPPAIIARYAAIGLPIEESSDPQVRESIAAAQASELKEINAEVTQLLNDAALLDRNPDWQKIEEQYLECEYKVSVKGLRGKLEPQLRASFETLTTHLSRRRSAHEAVIAIRNAIAELKESLAPGASGNAAAGSKPANYRHKYEKLRSLEKQVLSTSGQIAPELQEEIKSAYLLAQKRKLPQLLGLIGGAAALLLIVAFAAMRYLDNSELKEREALALSQLEAVESTGSLSEVATTLQENQATVQEAKDGSPLKEQAQILEEWVEMQRELETEYDRSIDAFAQLVEANDPMGDQSHLHEALERLNETRGGLADEIADRRNTRIDSLTNQWRSDVASAQRESAREIVSLHRAIADATQKAARAESQEQFEILKEQAEQDIALLGERLKQQNLQVDRAALDQFVRNTRKELQENENKWTALASLFAQLPQSQNLEQYLKNLQRIHSFDILPADTKSNIEQTLRLQDSITTLANRIALPKSAEAWRTVTGDSEYATTIVQLDDGERAFVNRLIDDAVFDNIYASTVQYFEGEAEPQSEYQILLVDPIAKSESDPGDSSLVFGFKVRGFDERGRAKPEPQEIQFISREDGSFWGFFYKPSTLSDETLYYRQAIKPALEQLKAGANRLFILQQIDRIEDETRLAPAFRAFWQGQFIELMSLHRWKWGMALSPSLQAKWKQLQENAVADISNTRWRSTLEQTVPSPEFVAAFEEKASEEAIKEIQAFSDLYSSIMDGNTTMVGYVSPDKTPLLSPDAAQSSDALWTANGLTGQLEPISDSIGWVPYAPILRYELSDSDPQALLKRIEFATGLDLNAEKFEDMLPPALK